MQYSFFNPKIQANWLWYSNLNAGVLYLITQRYKMKAIHNNFEGGVWQINTVFNHPKIQNESNSQHKLPHYEQTFNCI